MIELPGVADRLLAKIKRQPIFMGRRQTPKLPNRQQRMKRVWKQLIACSRGGASRMTPRIFDGLTSVDIQHLFAIFKQRQTHFWFRNQKGLQRRYGRIRSALGDELSRRNKRKAVKEAING